jgi:hypothetical protein
MKKRIFLFANIFFPLFIGTAIYFLTSPDVVFVEVINRIWGMYTLLDQSIVNEGIGLFIRYYLMDMFWAYALVFALYVAIGNTAARTEMAIGIAIVFSVAMEVIQLSPIIPGVFDVLDILVEIIAGAFAAYIIKKHYEEGSYICETK